MNNLTLISTAHQTITSSGTTCFDWCLEQNVVHNFNVDMASVGIVGVSYIFHVLYFLGEEYDFFKRYRTMFIYSSRLTLLIFFVYYFFYIKWGLIG